jgi:phage baseplate assembly protein W
MIPQLVVDATQKITFEAYPGFTYKVSDEQIAGDIDAVESLKQTILHILSTERYAHAIYTDNYGVELEQYIGETFEYLEVAIEETLQDALMQDDRILDVTVKAVIRLDHGSAEVSFDVKSIYGIIEEMRIPIVRF